MYQRMYVCKFVSMCVHTHTRFINTKMFLKVLIFKILKQWNREEEDIDINTCIELRRIWISHEVFIGKERRNRIVQTMLLIDMQVFYLSKPSF